MEPNSTSAACFAACTRSFSVRSPLLLTLGNDAYETIAAAWEARAEALRWNQRILVALSGASRLHGLLERTCLVDFVNESTGGGDAYQRWMVGLSKFQALEWALRHGFRTLFSELDVYFFDDPLRTLLPGAPQSMYFSANKGLLPGSGAPNIGFMYAEPSATHFFASVTRAWTTMRPASGQAKIRGDQAFFTTLLYHQGGAELSRPTNWSFLSREAVLRILGFCPDGRTLKLLPGVMMTSRTAVLHVTSLPLSDKLRLLRALYEGRTNRSAMSAAIRLNRTCGAGGPPKLHARTPTPKPRVAPAQRPVTSKLLPKNSLVKRTHARATANGLGQPTRNGR